MEAGDLSRPGNDIWRHMETVSLEALLLAVNGVVGWYHVGRLGRPSCRSPARSRIKIITRMAFTGFMQRYSLHFIFVLDPRF